ncbi:hypothetical protein [Nonomuraea pusilla]|uniref:hypothetical protein n=1 Tax=Nonomuraea pusilla TaxID=46177 RepID=UPI000B81621D|nr:hypothetical protein [Nonomuraea pusilla]
MGAARAPLLLAGVLAVVATGGPAAADREPRPVVSEPGVRVWRPPAPRVSVAPRVRPPAFPRVPSPREVAPRARVPRTVPGIPKTVPRVPKTVPGVPKAVLPPGVPDTVRRRLPAPVRPRIPQPVMPGQGVPGRGVSGQGVPGPVVPGAPGGHPALPRVRGNEVWIPGLDGPGVRIGGASVCVGGAVQVGACPPPAARPAPRRVPLQAPAAREPVRAEPTPTPSAAPRSRYRHAVAAPARRTNPLTTVLVLVVLVTAVAFGGFR